jgi:hypothetical protein
LNFEVETSDVIKTGSAETKTKTENECTEDEAETKTGRAETKTQTETSVPRPIETSMLFKAGLTKSVYILKIQNLHIKILH